TVTSSPASSRTSPSRPGGAATTIDSIASARRSASSDQAISGRPPTGTSAFGPPAPRRVPEPAAAITAVARAPLSGRGGTEALLEEVVDVLLRTLFVLLEGVHELRREDLLRARVHLLLASREALLHLANGEVAHDLGDLKDVAGLDLLAVVLEPAVPVLRHLRELAGQYVDDLLHLFGVDHPAQARAVGVLARDHDGHVVVQDLDGEVLALLA